MTRYTGGETSHKSSLWGTTATIVCVFLLSFGWAQEAVAPEEMITGELQRAASELEDPSDLDPLLERIGDARYVLLGEATHGTSEFYTWRAHISRRLIEEKGFSVVAVEGDWPDAYRVNEYIRGVQEGEQDAYSVLNDFARWPTWMWANWEIVAFAEWLRQHNDGLQEAEQAGFYGLDVYSMWESLEVILGYLESSNATALAAAQQVSECLAPFRPDVQAYAAATVQDEVSCTEEVEALLAEVSGTLEPGVEETFNIIQNAHVVLNAEAYYQAMVRDSTLSWNIRDTHMADTVDRLVQHFGPDTKVIIWEHNTHIGDARATDMADFGMVNIGQLLRERHGEEDVVLVGFGTYEGTVIAAQAWEAPMQVMEVPPAREGSWEDLFQRTTLGDSLLIMNNLEDEAPFLEPRGHRAIGVVYNPRYESMGNYVRTVLPQRYDAFIFIAETEALHPLHVEPREQQPPELYPWGF
jgi:erythromycin esterase